MKLLPAVTRRTYIIGGTMLILLTIFGFYFLVFLPKKERNIIAQRVRALHRIEENFQEKYRVYQKVADEKTNDDLDNEYKAIYMLNQQIELAKEKLKTVAEEKGNLEETLRYQKKFRAELKKYEKEVNCIKEKISLAVKSNIKDNENLSVYKADGSNANQVIRLNSIKSYFSYWFRALF